MYADPGGNFLISAFLIAGLIAGAIIGSVAGGITAYNLASEVGATGWELFGYTALGVLGGAIVGGTLGAVVGAGIGTFASGVSAIIGSIGGGGTLAFAGGGIAEGSAALTSIAISVAVKSGVIAGVLSTGLMLMAKPDSGRIRFSDGTGRMPDGKEMTQKQAEEAYNNSKDPIYRAKLKKWMKGKGYRHSHLKGVIFLPLAGEWLRRLLNGDW